MVWVYRAECWSTEYLILLLHSEDGGNTRSALLDSELVAGLHLRSRRAVRISVHGLLLLSRSLARVTRSAVFLEDVTAAEGVTSPGAGALSHPKE